MLQKALATGMKRLNENRVIKYLLAGVMALIAEVCICNISAICSLWSVPQDITESCMVSGALTLEDGNYLAGEGMSLQWEDIDWDVEQLYVGIRSDQQEYLCCNIYVRDEGTAATYYQITEQAIFPEQGYVTIHPYGHLRGLVIQLDAEVGDTISIERAVLNPHRPFQIRWERILAIFIVLSGVIAFRKGSRLHQIMLFQENERLGKRRLVTIGLFVLLSAGILLYLNRVIIPAEEYDDTTQYNLLARSLTEGRCDLDYAVDPQLLTMDNPYDKSAREALGVDYQWDVAYYQGHYYCYFGIVPVLMVHLPYYLITGQDLSGVSATYVFAVLFLLAAVWVMFELLRYFSPKVPFYVWPMSVLLTVFSAAMIINIQRASIYKIPSLSGNAFLCAGLAAYVHYLYQNRGDAEESYHGWLIFGSLCMALMVGCRPQMGLAILVIIPFFWHNAQKEIGLPILAPFVLVGGFLMYYNYVRFGSVFDFGAAYNLTTNDMTRRGFHLDRLPGGLFIYLLQPANLMAKFPFVGCAVEWTDYPGVQITEKVYGGVLACNLITWVLLPACYLKTRIREKRAGALLLIMLGIAAVICCADICGAGILQRYQSDFATLILIAAIIVFGIMLERDFCERRLRYTVLAQWMLVCVIAVVAYDFCVSWQFMSQDSMIDMYYQMRSLLMF